MANLYKRAKNMVTKANSKLSLIKGTIKDKNGSIIDENSFSTIADEVRSIGVISNPNPEVLINIGGKTFTDRYVYRSVTNGKTGVSLLFYKNADGEYLSEYGYINKGSNGDVVLYSMPQKEDGSFYTLGENDVIFPVHDYFFIRFTGSEIIDFISSDGKKWDPEITKVLSGYRCLEGNFFALTDRSVSLLVHQPKSFSTDPYDLYEMDFVGKRMILNETCEGVFQYENASTENLSARTDNVYYSIPKTINNGSGISSIMIYSKLSDPFNHQSVELGEELSTLFSSFRSMIRTAKNTIAIAAIDEGNKIDIIEIIFTLTNAVPHVAKRIIETNIVMNGDAKLSIYQGVYLISTGSTIKWSYDLEIWHDLNIATNFGDGETITDVTVDNRYVYVHTNLGASTTLSLSMIVASDVPEGKVFITQEGELAKGTAGNTFSSALRTGLVSSINVSDKAFLNDTFTFDPREQAHAFNHITYYGDEYLFAVGFLNKLTILRSRDGFSWTKGFETETLGINFITGKFNRWHFEVYNGILYFMQSNVLYAEAGVFRVEIHPDRIDLIEDSGVFWNKTEAAQNFNLLFINPVCSGLLYGYYSEDSSHLDRLVVVDDYGINTIYDKPMDVTQIVDIANRDDGAVIFSNVGFRVVIDEKVYENDIDIAHNDFSSMKILLYKNILIILQRSFDINIPFISFYKLSEATMSADKVEDTDLPDEYRLFRRKPFLPIGDVCNNLLIIDDYNCMETAFIIDLEDKFKIVKYEDDTDMNRNKFIQFCNGKIFLINQFRKSKSIKTGNIGIERDWIDLAASNQYYLTIAADDQFVYYSKNGLDWKVLEAYANDGLIANRIVAGGKNIAVAYLGESEYVWVSTDEGISWYQMWFPWKFWVQNVEMLHTTNGYELFIYAKLNPDDPYNIIYSSYDFAMWNETSINSVNTNNLTDSEWRDITCSEDGMWAAIDESTTRVIHSSDGTLWEESIMPRKQEWSSVIHTKKGFFATARHSKYAAYSVDGLEWVEILMPEEVGVMEKDYDWVSAAPGKINGEEYIVVVSGNSLFAAGPDIFSLELYHTLPDRDWKRVVYQDDKFVAIAANTSRGAYSEDGLTWHDNVLPTSANWIHLLYASGAFVAIDAECKNMATSINGITWMTEQIEDGKVYRFIDYRNDKFVIFQIEGTVEKSEWVYEYVGTSDTLKEWISGSAYRNGFVFTSTDGVVVNKNNDENTWNIKTLPCGVSETQWLEYTFKDNLTWTNLCEGKGKKVILGINSNKGVWSEDGVQWIPIRLPFSGDWINVVYVLNRFVAISRNDNRYITSYDGISWKVSELPVSADWIGATVANQRLYLYSSDSTKYYVSNNLIAWKAYDREGRVWSTLAFNGTNLIGIVEGYAVAYISSDGITWETTSLGLVDNWHRAFFVENVGIITARNSNVMLYSEDGGVTWEKRLVNDSNEDWKVEFLEDKFYLLGNNTDIAYVSSDGKAWVKTSLKYSANWIGGWKISETEDTLATYNLFAQNIGMIQYSYDGTYFHKLSRVDEMMYGNGMFVVIDRALDTNTESIMYYSYDLISWEISKPKLNGKLLDIAYGDGRFMLISTKTSNFAFESTDIVNWKLLAVPTKGKAEKIIYGQKGFVILEDTTSGILLMENNFNLKSYNLPSNMNALVTSSGSVTIAFDMNTGDFYISHNNRESWSQVEYPTIELINIGEVKSVSTTDTLIYYTTSAIYLYSTLRDMWYILKAPFDNILGFEEISVLTETGNERRIVVYSSNNIAYIDNATRLTGEIEIGEIITSEANIQQLVENSEMDGYSILYEDGSIDGSFINVEYDGNEGENVVVTKIARCNGIYLATTDSRYFYTSKDFESWYRHTWPLDLIPSYLEVSQNHFVVLASNGYCTYFITSANGEDFNYIDFVDTYDTEPILMTSNYNIFISKYGNVLDEIILKEYYFLLNTIGKSKSKYDRISPIRPAFAKGSFKVTESNQDIKISLDFTPSKVYVRSMRLDENARASHIMISDESIFHQEVNSDIGENNSNMSINLTAENISVDTSSGSRIVAYGFHVTPNALGDYIYYAFN